MQEGMCEKEDKYHTTKLHTTRSGRDQWGDFLKEQWRTKKNCCSGMSNKKEKRKGGRGGGAVGEQRTEEDE